MDDEFRFRMWFEDFVALSFIESEVSSAINADATKPFNDSVGRDPRSRL